MNTDPQFYVKKITELAMSYGPKIVLAFLTLFIGSWIISLCAKALDRALTRVTFDETLKPYLVGIASTLCKVVLYISVIGMLGIETTSFIAVLGAAGLAVGMALQGSLGNFAGGVLILIFKPIKKGDFIESNGIAGTVESIQPFVTVLLSPDKVVHYIPNGLLSSSSIKNFSIHQERRVDLTFGIGYGDDIDHAKEIFNKVINDCPGVIRELEPIIFVTELAASSVNFAVRVFCKPVDYWTVYAYMQENVKKELDKAKISIPFPQQELHIRGRLN